MKTFKKITQEIEVIDKVYCNRCGESCGLPDADGCPHGLIEATVHGGYHSKLLVDQERYTFSLCEPCLFAMFATFKHKILIRYERELG